MRPSALLLPRFGPARYPAASTHPARPSSPRVAFDNRATFGAAATLAGSPSRMAEMIRRFRGFGYEASTGDAGFVTLFKALKATDPTMKLRRYRHGTNVEQTVDIGGAAWVEQNMPLKILVLWAGSATYSNPARYCDSGLYKLTGDLTSSGTTVTLSASIVGADKADSASSNTTWPFYASRGVSPLTTTSYSTDRLTRVGWCRIGDEIIGIPVGGLAASAGTITITGAVRGMWGTTATAHPTGAKVLAPIFAGDGTYAYGYPVDVAPDAPYNDNPLRYYLHPEGTASYFRWAVDQLHDADWDGLTGMYWDICSPSFYGAVDQGGYLLSNTAENSPNLWDPATDTGWTVTEWAASIAGKYDEFVAAFAGTPIVHHTPNGYRWNGNGTSLLDSTRTSFMAAGHGWTSYQHELWMETIPGDFTNDVTQLLGHAAGNRPAYIWCKRGAGGGGTAVSLRRFTFAAFMLGWKPGIGMEYASGWGPTADADATADPVTSGMEPFHLFDYGDPAEYFATWAELDAAKITTGVYRRRFNNGIVVVNTTGSPVAVNLGAGYWDVSAVPFVETSAPTTTTTVAASDAFFGVRY